MIYEKVSDVYIFCPDITYQVNWALETNYLLIINAESFDFNNTFLPNNILKF